MNANSCIEVSSVSEFLDAVKQIYCDQDHQLFYRGVSKVQYATPEHDHPGIYRNKNWIDNEDKMFYELTAKCPEYFKDCKTTFEHLVMMQHYGYPTRLLDITSNPLVALYFACGGLNGSNLEDGQLISYHIKKNDIRNHEDLKVTLLANLSKINCALEWKLFGLYQHQSIQITNGHFMAQNITRYWDLYKEKLLENEMFREFKHKNILEIFAPLKTLLGGLIFKNQIFSIIGHDNKYKDFWQFSQDVSFKFLNKKTLTLLEYERILSESTDINIELYKLLLVYLSEDIYQDIISLKINRKALEQIQRKSELLSVSIDYYISNFGNGIFYDFLGNVKNDFVSFDTSMVSAIEMLNMHCVLPKQNNPRLIAQQGAFLLFGFKDAVSDKTATPIVPDEMYGKYQIITQYENGQVIEKQQSSHKAEIIIKGDAKKAILAELKILGISNSTMFPEIDNIANELKNQYMK